MQKIRKGFFIQNAHDSMDQVPTAMKADNGSNVAVPNTNNVKLLKWHIQNIILALTIYSSNGTHPCRRNQDHLLNAAIKYLVPVKQLDEGRTCSVYF